MSNNLAQSTTTITAVHIGRWIIPAVPSGWTWIPGFGIQKHGENTIPSNVYLKEDELLAGNDLTLYIQSQITIMKRTFLEPLFAGPGPLEFSGADESAMLMLKHQPMNHVTVVQVQHYLKMGKWIGISTLTTLESELQKVRPDFEQFMKQLHIE
jgi:hypothetical protein